MGYDALELRQQLAFRGTACVIPSQPTRKHPWPLDAETYKERNLVERSFSRLKDFRRVATRYDKLTRVSQLAAKKPHNWRFCVGATPQVGTT